MSHPSPQPDPSIESQHGRSSGFQTTDWSALANLNTPEFAEALAKLCQQYWYPVYAFIRRRAGTTHRAEDLTQAFFFQSHFVANVSDGGSRARKVSRILVDLGQELPGVGV